MKRTITPILVVLFALLACCPFAFGEQIPCEKTFEQSDVANDVPKHGDRLFQGFGLGMYIAAAGDVVSTEWALSNPGMVEQNPLMANRAVRISAHVLAPTAVWWSTNWMRKQGHGRAALLLRIGITAGYSYVAIHNIRASTHP